MWPAAAPDPAKPVDLDDAAQIESIEVEPLVLGREAGGPRKASDFGARAQPVRAWGWASSLTLSWLWPLVLKGYAAPLMPHDLPQLEPRMQAAAARADATTWWQARLAANEQPTLLGMAWHCNRYEIVVGCATSTVYGLVNVVVRPLLLKITIETVARLAEGADGSGGGGDAASDTLTSVLLVVAIGGSLLVEGLGEEAGRHHATICLPVCAHISPAERGNGEENSTCTNRPAGPLSRGIVQALPVRPARHLRLWKDRRFDSPQVDSPRDRSSANTSWPDTHKPGPPCLPPAPRPLPLPAVTPSATAQRPWSSPRRSSAQTLCGSTSPLRCFRWYQCV